MGYTFNVILGHTFNDHIVESYVSDFDSLLVDSKRTFFIKTIEFVYIKYEFEQGLIFFASKKGGCIFFVSRQPNFPRWGFRHILIWRGGVDQYSVRDNGDWNEFGWDGGGSNIFQFGGR